MSYYMDQPCTPFFPFGLVKTGSDLIVKSVETGSGRQMLVAAVLSVDAYPFSAFQTWPVTLKIQKQMFSGCTVPSDSKDTKLGSSSQEAFPSAGKNSGVVLCHTWKCIPAISSGVQIFKVPACHLLCQMGSQWGSQKLLQGLVSLKLLAYHSISDLFLTQ